jgi:hypothetical protein
MTVGLPDATRSVMCAFGYAPGMSCRYSRLRLKALLVCETTTDGQSRLKQWDESGLMACARLAQQPRANVDGVTCPVSSDQRLLENGGLRALS